MILAIDYGKRNIGLALSDETETFSSPLPMIVVKDDAEAIEGIKHVLANIQGVSEIIIGIPFGLDMKPTKMSNTIKKFTLKLNEALDEQIKVTFTSEVGTSKQAELGKSKKFKKEKSHSEAARIFLQEYLEHKKMLRD